jgi:hypothetical protein
MINWKNNRFLLIGVLVLVVSVVLVNHFHQKKAGQVLVEVKPISSSNGWGYEIIADGKVYIHQEFIPAIPGRHGFKTSDDAVKVGKKVVAKISANQIPPTITVDELKEMGIVNDSLQVK